MGTSVGDRLQYSLPSFHALHHLQDSPTHFIPSNITTVAFASMCPAESILYTPRRKHIHSKTLYATPRYRIRDDGATPILCMAPAPGAKASTC